MERRGWFGGGLGPPPDLVAPRRSTISADMTYFAIILHKHNENYVAFENIKLYASMPLCNEWRMYASYLGAWGGSGEWAGARFTSVK